MVGRKLRVIADLRGQGGTTDHQQPTGSPHLSLQSYPKLRRAAGTPGRGRGGQTGLPPNFRQKAPEIHGSLVSPRNSDFSTLRWKSLWKSTRNSPRKLSNTRRSLTFCTYIQQYWPCPT